ncbi:hypothetical protein ACFLQR_05520, partial [Verrucomicrobiota bacterium]
LSRPIPRFARGFFYPEASMGNVNLGPNGVRQIFREMAEINANCLTCPVKRYEKGSKWWSDEPKSDELFKMAEIYGLGILVTYHFAVEDRGWHEGAEEALKFYPKYGSYIGFCIDEPRYSPYGGAWGEVCRPPVTEFREYLKDKYPPEELKKRGVDDIAAVALPKADERAQKPWLWAELGRLSKKTLHDWMKRDLDYAAGFDPNLISTLDLQHAIGVPVWRGALGAITYKIVVCEPYDRASFKQVWQVEMLRSTSGKPTWKFIAPGLAYARNNPDVYRRSMYQAMMHGDGVLVFAWNTVYKQITGWSGSRKLWIYGHWEVTAEMFGKMALTGQDRYMRSPGSGQ